jgi:hypothetical protein
MAQSHPHTRFDSTRIFRILGAAAAVSCLGLASSAGASSGGGSWSQYLNTKVGTTCILSNSFRVGNAQVGYSTISSFVQQRLHAIRNNPGGPVYVYSLRTGATSSPNNGSNIPPTTVAYPLQVLNDGDLGVADDIGQLVPGVKYAIKGEELYPSIATLKGGGSVRSSLTISEYGTTPAGKAEVAKEVTSGNALIITVSYLITSAPVRASITTPTGTYTNIVGVHVDNPRSHAVNVSSVDSSTINAVVKALSGSGTNLYFAKGVGEVSSSTSGFTLSLSGCHE